MAWIKSEQTLATHRKTMVLESELSIETPQVIGHLHLLWWWALDNAPDGNLVNIPIPVIARVSLWKGDPIKYVKSMVVAGFLDENPLRIHDWEDFTGKLIEKRNDNRLRMQLFRATHVQRTSTSRASVRVEKSRVEKNKESIKKITDNGFDKFWSLYPKKCAKQDALKAFRKINPDETLLSKITEKLSLFCASEDWTKDNGKFIPHPASWLNGHRWEDELGSKIPNVQETGKKLTYVN